MQAVILQETTRVYQRALRRPELSQEEVCSAPVGQFMDETFPVGANLALIQSVAQFFGTKFYACSGLRCWQCKHSELQCGTLIGMGIKPATRRSAVIIDILPCHQLSVAELLLVVARMSEG